RVTRADRWPELPDVPPVAALVFLVAPYRAMSGIGGPAAPPAAVIDTLNAAINDGLRSSELRASLTKLGIDPMITSPREFAAIIAREIPKWAEVVRITGVKAAE